MIGTRVRCGSLITLLLGVLLVMALAPSSARAAWRSADAHILDSGGTGFVPVLNVRVANRAANDSAAVIAVEISDDGVAWYSMPYTGQAQDWVLAGAAGRKALFVRFAAADGTLSPIIRAGITVDTTGPSAVALRSVHAGAGGVAGFRFTLRDDQSPRVHARLLVRGGGIRRCLDLGAVRTGTHLARVALRVPRGTYRWSILATDLAGWTQEKQVSRMLVVK